MSYKIKIDEAQIGKNINGKTEITLGEDHAREIFRQVLKKIIADDMKIYRSGSTNGMDNDFERAAETFIRTYDPNESYWSNIERVLESN